MPKKDITTRQLEDSQMEMGLEMEEIFLTRAGKFLLDVLDQARAVTCVEAILAKYSKDSDGDKKGTYKCSKVEEFWLQRGVALGLQEALDKIKSTINIGKRVAAERRKESEELKSKT